MGRFAKKRWTAEERAEKIRRRHEHLRQIKGSYVHRQTIHGEFFHAGDDVLATFLNMLEQPGPILGACNERHARKLENLSGRRVFWQVDRPVDPDDVLGGKIYRKPDVQGPLERVKFNAPFKGAFVCERLQKQPNLFNYLQALRGAVEPDGPIALVVPNAHHELVDEHFHLFTAGTLIYNLVRAGFNCRDAVIYWDKRFLNVLVRRRDVPEPAPLKVDDLTPYVPFRNVFNYCSSEFPEVYR